MLLFFFFFFFFFALLAFFFFFFCVLLFFFFFFFFVACFTVSSIAGIRSSALTLSAKNLSSEAHILKRCGSITSFECHISVT